MKLKLVLLICLFLLAFCTYSGDFLAQNSGRLRGKLLQKIKERQQNRKSSGNLYPSVDLPSQAAGAPLAPGDYLRRLESRGRIRWYKIHVPPGYRQNKDIPVVLLFHGGAGNPDQQRYDADMDAYSDKYRFVAAYPAGTGPLSDDRLLTWNCRVCCGYARKKNVDDVGFVRDLLDDLATFVPYDRRRVYATGLSNGALMCYRLASGLSDRIAAIAPVAGIVKEDVFKGPARIVPIIHFHGMQDQNALYNGGMGPKALSKEDIPGLHPPVKEAILSWVECYGLPTKPLASKQIGKATGEFFGNSRAGDRVCLWTLEDGGHTWPGGRMTKGEQRLGLGHINTDISACELMWQFFRQFKLPE